MFGAGGVKILNASRETKVRAAAVDTYINIMYTYRNPICTRLCRWTTSFRKPK